MKINNIFNKYNFDYIKNLFFVDNFFIRRQTFGNQESQDQNFFLDLKK